MVKPLTNPFADRPTPLGSLLTAASQRLAAQLDRALTAAGFPDLRAAHAPLFMALDPDGSRVTDLADRAKMSKQAVGELIRYLVDHGYLCVTTDTRDRRVRRVHLTGRGWQAIQVGEHVIDNYDRWLDQLVGPAQVEQVRQVLTRIADQEPETEER